MRTSADYVLPRTEREARRLELQAEMLSEATERALAALPLRAGMTCVDVGCGTGDSLELIARHVGPSGRIVGLDLDTTAARARLDRLRAACTIDLIEGDVLGAPALPERDCDLVFTRYLIHHFEAPATALARMWEWTRPGGTLVVLDIDSRATTTYPLWPPYEQLERWVAELYVKLRVDNHVGHKLPHLFERAGIGAPDGIQVTGLVRTIAELAEFLPLLLDMIRDKLTEHGLATVADVDALAAELETAGEQRSIYCHRPALVAVWRTKPA